MKLEKKDVYVPVGLNNDGNYTIIGNEWFRAKVKKEKLYTFSEEELRKLLSSVSDVGVDYMATTFTADKSFEEYKSEYINNLLKQD